jgi:hypothetical protein
MFIKKSNYKALLSEIEGLKNSLGYEKAYNEQLEKDIDFLKKKLNDVLVSKPTKVKDNSIESKIKAIQNHLETKGNITSWEAIELYNYTRLSDAIYRLKRKGMDISTTPEEYNNATFVRYHLNKAVK